MPDIELIHARGPVPGEGLGVIGIGEAGIVGRCSDDERAQRRARARQTGFNQLLQELDLLIGGERIAFAVGAEDGAPATI
jgi:hypothetical protein